MLLFSERLKQSQWAMFAILAALIGLNILFRLHFLSFTLPGDNSAYAYIGHSMLQGERLYTDLVDNKPPAIYITYMLAEKIWGYGTPAIVFLSTFFSIASLILIFLILLKTNNKTTALIGTVFWVLASNSRVLDMDFPNTEFFISTFILIAFWSYLKYFEGKTNWLWVTGSALAIASAYKTNVVFISAMFCLALILPSIQKGKKQLPALKELSSLILPSVVLWAIIFLYFYSQNRFIDFWNVNYVAMKNYVGNIWLNELTNLFSAKFFYSPYLKEILVLVIFSYLWIALNLIKFFSSRFAYLYLIIFTGCLLMTGSIRDIPHPNYYQLLVPFFCLMAAMFCSNLNDYLISRKSSLKIIVGITVLIPVFYLSYFQIKNQTFSIKPAPTLTNLRPDDDRQLGQLLGSLTRPDETLYQWGLAPGIYFYSKRNAASGIVLNHILYFTPLDLRTHLYNKLISDIGKSKPAFIVFTSWAFRLDQEPWMDPFKIHYRFLGLFGKSAIFEKKDRPTPAKLILSQLNIPAESKNQPWKNPHLILFPGWKSTRFLDPERFKGKPLLPSGNGLEADLINQGIALFQQNQFIKGRDVLAKALEINPNNLAAQAEMGVYNEATGQYFLALENYQTVAEKFPHPYTEYYIETQNLLMQQGAFIAPPDK